MWMMFSLGGLIMNKKISFILIGLLLLVLVIISVLYFVKINKTSSPVNNNNSENIIVNISNIYNHTNYSNSDSNSVGRSTGKLTPKNISTKVDIANSSNKTNIIGSSTIIGTNTSMPYTQNVTNISAEKKAAENWCVMGSPMNYAKVPNSNEWVVADMRYYTGHLYCYTNKSGSTTSYLFNEGYSSVYSVEGKDRPTYTLIS